MRLFDQAEQATQRAFGMFALMTRFSNDWMRDAVVPGGLAQILLSSHLLVVAPAGLLMAAPARSASRRWRCSSRLRSALATFSAPSRASATG
ncbi:MAG: hypothetical protein HC829_00010 [Bacteroidales bacterium]|nr:hypothetical protein [Bacteroidales bacterium]